ncbi:hypothetical protein BDZ89DRAFT_1248333 [Hymenopellis radicata]|nr:hypothetical protein BDZ89DRAFT_1248333 [Hymenopellis radicata]
MAPIEVEQQEPTGPHMAATLEYMRAQGVKVLYGRCGRSRAHPTSHSSTSAANTTRRLEGRSLKFGWHP